jgi:hypothetical protein
MALSVIVAFGCAPIGRHHHDTVSINLSAGWKKADELNQQGIGHFHAGKCDLAESEFRQAIRANEGHGGAHNNLGLIYYNRRNLVKAAHHFGKAVEYTPDNPSPVNNLGMALEAGGRVSEAIELYRQAHQMAPANPLFLGNLVRAKVRMGDRDELVIQQLRDLAFCETRPEWIDWADEQLAIHLNPSLDRGPQLSNGLGTDANTQTATSEFANSRNSNETAEGAVLIGPHDVGDLYPQPGNMYLPRYEPPQPDEVFHDGVFHDGAMSRDAISGEIMSGASIVDGYPSGSIDGLKLSPATSMPQGAYPELSSETLPAPTMPGNVHPSGSNGMIQLQSATSEIVDDANELVDVDVDALDKR